MIPGPFDTLYLAAAVFFIGSLGCLLVRRRHAARICQWAGTAAAVAVLVMIILKAKRMPLISPFENIFLIVSVLTILDLISPSAFEHHRVPPSFLSFRTRLVLAVNLILLFFLAFTPRAPAGDYYMYTDIWVNLFFSFRTAACALFLFAGIHFILEAGLNKATDHPDIRLFLSWQGRNFLLAGTCVYLVSECSGSYWCLNWLGDVWHWSRGFLWAAVIFLIIMAYFHTPPFLSRSRRIKPLIGILPGVVCLWMILG